MSGSDSSSEEPRDIGGFFEALCAGQSKEQVVDDMVSKGWPRDEAIRLAEKLEEHVSAFLAAGREPDEPQIPDTEEPMKSFRLSVGNPTRDAAQIARSILQALIALGMTALIMYSCGTM